MSPVVPAVVAAVEFSGVDSALLSLSSSPPHAATSNPTATIAAAANRFPRTGCVWSIVSSGIW